MVLDLAARALRLLPAETAHNATLALTGMASPLLPRAPADDPRLAVTALGLSFPNPVGLAAGFDKNASVPGAMAKLGFGFVECGTVTPRPQAGNPRPRLFRLAPDRAVINRMGFNNQGMAAAARNFATRPARGIVGINIGANKDSPDRVDDYARAFDVLGPLADYVTVNVSSPNTPDLRGLQNRDELSRLLGTLTAVRMWAHARSRPSSAMPSAGGLKAGARNVSMQCATASIPVAAVMSLGNVKVNSGSQIASLGTRYCDNTPSLRPSSRISTAPLPTSLPVPAVVGIAIIGTTLDVILFTPPSIAAYWRSGPG